MMLLQSFLRSGGSLTDLGQKYAIKTRRHTTIPHLVLFKYDQINSPFAEPLVRECRGVILDESQDWNVVARAFDKFFNHGEGHAAPIDWPTARVQEKLDGSLAVLYHYDGEWRVATTGTPDACGNVNGASLTFADLFWRTFLKQSLLLPDGHTNKAFLFELTGPLNRVVVQHFEERLTLLGIRRRDGKEYPPEAHPEFPAVRSFPLQSFEQITETFGALEPLKQEGYVVVDGAFNRVKVKHPGYVALHHMRDGMSPRRVLEVVRAGETTEVLAAFPEWREHFEDVAARLDAFAVEVATDYERLRGIPEQKAFALEADKTRCSAALFQIRRGTIQTPRDYFREMQIDRLAELLGLREEPIVAEAA